MRECFSQREVPDTATDLQPPKEQILVDTGEYRAIGLEVPFADPKLLLGHVMLNQDGVRHLDGFDRCSRRNRRCFRYCRCFSWCHDDFLHWLTSQVILNQKGELSQLITNRTKYDPVLRSAQKKSRTFLKRILSIYLLFFFLDWYSFKEQIVVKRGKPHGYWARAINHPYKKVMRETLLFFWHKSKS